MIPKAEYETFGRCALINMVDEQRKTIERQKSVLDREAQVHKQAIEENENLRSEVERLKESNREANKEMNGFRMQAASLEQDRDRWMNRAHKADEEAEYLRDENEGLAAQIKSLRLMVTNQIVREGDG